MLDWRQFFGLETAPAAGEPAAYRRRVWPRRVDAKPQDVYRDVAECRCVGPVPDPPLLRGWEGRCGRCNRPREAS